METTQIAVCLYSGISYSDEKEQTLAIHKVDESHGYNVEQRKPDTKEYTSCDSIYTKDRQNTALALEVRIEFTFVGGID